MSRHDSGRSRAVLGLLVLACVTIITLDARHEPSGSPVDPLRSAVGAALGPVEDGAAAALRPVTNIPDHFGDVHDLRQRNTALQRRVDELTRSQHAHDANAHRADEAAGIAGFASTSGFDVTPAQVIAMGPAQSFSRTVTIDAGTNDGVVPDLTVINADGLVGRVIRASPSTATVLLVIDTESTVGARLSRSMELGFLNGGGDITDAGALTLSLVDHTVSPRHGDSVVTWGSQGDAPYLPGIPVGRVVHVRASPADLTQTAKVRPYVDFSALDVVGVVTDHRGGSDTSMAKGGR
ncbi:MAG: rod shape-determining protein MreC [Nocardioidaceae bacterium]